MSNPDWYFDPPEEGECPMCGASIEEVGYGKLSYWKCTECDWAEDTGADTMEEANE
jgi:ribosomal protein L37AE/L43A